MAEGVNSEQQDGHERANARSEDCEQQDGHEQGVSFSNNVASCAAMDFTNTQIVIMLKSASIRRLENEGGLKQSEFFEHSPYRDEVALSCLATIRNLTETGAFGEAEDELEKVVRRSPPERRGTACLLLAELFNKWGAASKSYPINIMERGAKYASDAVGFFSSENSSASASNVPLTAEEKLLYKSLYWKALNFATVGALGGCQQYPLTVAFREADKAQCHLKTTGASKIFTAVELLRMKATQLFVEATILFCRAKALHSAHLTPADVNGKTHIEMWQRCLEMYFEAYQLLSTQEDLWFDSMDPLGNDATKAVAMLAVCNILLERRHAAIEWATQEVALRIRLFGVWNPRTKRAQQVLYFFFFTCVRIPLYICSHTSIYVFSYLYICGRCWQNYSGHRTQEV